MPVSRATAVVPPSASIVWDALITPQYDNRISSASVNTTFALDDAPTEGHQCDMLSADEILARLKDMGIKQPQIAEVLGISQPGVATLYTKNKLGKPRKLGYDEGIKLIQAFGLSAEADAPPQPWLPKPETIADLLAFAMKVDEDDLEKRGELLDYAHALHAGLTWIAKEPASEDDPGFLKAVRLRVVEEVDATNSTPSRAA